MSNLPRENGEVRNAVKSVIDADAIGATLVVNLLALAMPLAMLQVFDRVLPKADAEMLSAIFFVLVAVILLDLALKILRDRIMGASGQLRESLLGHRAIDSLFDADAAALRSVGQEEVVDRLTAMPRLRQYLSGGHLNAAIDSVFALGFLAVLAAVAGPLVGVPLIVIASIAVLAAFLRGPRLPAVNARIDNDRRRTAFLTEVFTTTRLVKTVGIEPQVLRRYENLHNSASDANETLVRLTDIRSTAQTMAGQGATALTCAFGAYLAINGAIGLAELSASMLLATRAAQPFVRLLFPEAQIEFAQQAARRLSELIAVPRAAIPFGDQTLDGSIRFESVKCAPQSSAAPGLECFDLCIAPGELVTVEGPLGSGAELVLPLIAGELRPDRGHIRLGGTAPGDPCPPTGPGGAILLDRAPQIFSASLRDNLSAFRGHLAERRANDVARLLGVDECFRYLPGGPDCNLSSRSETAGSVAFYAQIALARAIALEPRILLLDSPFADLDPPAARNLEEVLGDLRGGMTIVVRNPTPRISRLADRRVEFLGAPRAAEAGTPRHEPRLAGAERDGGSLGARSMPARSA